MTSNDLTLKALLIREAHKRNKIKYCITKVGLLKFLLRLYTCTSNYLMNLFQQNILTPWFTLWQIRIITSNDFRTGTIQIQNEHLLLDHQVNQIFRTQTQLSVDVPSHFQLASGSEHHPRLNAISHSPIRCFWSPIIFLPNNSSLKCINNIKGI